MGAWTTHHWIETGVSILAEEALDHGLVQRRVTRAALPTALQTRYTAARRLDEVTHLAVHATTELSRRPRGRNGATTNLAALVGSAAQRGLKDRILAYTQRQLRK